jgi:hypothetical protein
VFIAHDANVTSKKLGASQTISSLPSHTNPNNADSIPIVDSISATTKRITWANLTSALQTYFSTLYSPIFSTSAQLAGLLSDETGTGGGFVRAASPTITTPTITTPTLDVAGTDATGDIYYNGGSGVLTRLPIGPGPSYYLRTSAGGIPEWDNNILSSIVTASTTFKATTSIAADSVTNGALILNGLAYSWPSLRGNKTQQFLTDNGNGVLSFASTTGLFWATTTSAIYANSGSAIMTIPVPASTLGTMNGIYGRLYVTWRSNTVATKSLTLKYGNSTCATASAVPSSTGLRDFKGYIEFDIRNAGATNSQMCYVSFVGTVDEFNIGGATAIASLHDDGALSVDSTQNQDITLEYTQGSGGFDLLSVWYGYAVLLK